MFPSILTYIQEAEKHFDEISEARKQLLVQISQYVAKKIKAGEKAELIYICTHNSRRSHFGQIWAKTAASYYGYHHVTTYSGGTEATAFNPNAIRATEKVGFKIEKDATPTNPRYTIHYQESGDTILCFSKKYDDPSNPQDGFCAIMTCTEADGACPVVQGAEVRVSTPYNDPKAFDNTPEQDAKYSERCLEIATETLYVFSLVKSLL
jgi:protein-tyrosine-phosphatase